MNPTAGGNFTAFQGRRRRPTAPRVWLVMPAALLFTALLGAVPAPSVPAPDRLAAAVDVYRHGDLASARGLLEPLAQLDGTVGGRAAYLLGAIDVAQKRYDDADAAFRRAADAHPLIADHAVYYEGVAEFDGGHFHDAAAKFQDVLQRFRDSSLRGLALFWRAEGLWSARDPEAPAAFHRYLEQYGGGRHAAQAWFDMGQSLEQQGLWADAAQAYRRIPWAFETSPYAASARARLAALAQAHALPPDATPVDVFFQRAQTEFEAGDGAAAWTDLQRVLAMPRAWVVNDGTFYTMGVLMYWERRFRDATSWFKRDLALKQTHADDSLFYLTRIALTGGRDAEALGYASRLATEYPKSPLAAQGLYLVAEARAERGAMGPAMSLYKEAGDRFPMTRWGSRALWQVGWLLSRQAQWTAARAAWIRAGELSAGTDAAAASWYWAGRAAAQLGHADLAADSYHRAASLYGDTYYGQQAAARLGAPVRAAIASASPDVPAGVIPTLDRFHELDSLAQTDDATAELEAAALAAPASERTAVVTLLSGRYTDASDPRRGIGAAEDARDALGVPAPHRLPLAVWQALYPRAQWPVITQAAARAGLDPYLIAGLIREESRFDAGAVSSAGAYGLMQLMPGTAQSTARSLGMAAPDQRGLVDPATNIALGAGVLKAELVRFGRADLALAAYNAGPNMVRRWMSAHPGADSDTFIETVPYGETRGYIKTVQQSAAMYRWLYQDGHPAAAP
ncbi:MAG TPA: transglycosylase SLT domain-containing protein [bacterium]|nr:transglycosylase SLT domain-containing protein [bacterium]